MLTEYSNVTRGLQCLIYFLKDFLRVEFINHYDATVEHMLVAVCNLLGDHVICVLVQHTCVDTAHSHN